MLDTIVHRGPDDSGTYVNNRLAMGMRRLSIIDVDGGHQPIRNESGDVVIVFNGENYNFVELRDELSKRGHTFSTRSDVETVVHLYEEDGAKVVEHLRGMYGFALWDDRKQQLLIVRDRLGIKPLYYAEVNGQLIFASEIKSLLLHPDLAVELDPVSLGQYVTFKYVPAPRTMFRGIYSLPPGHLLTANDRGVHIRQYWDLTFEPPRKPKSEDEYADELQQLLHESVKLRLQSDVPFGAFLSGGVDSSTIVAIMSELLDEPVKTFSVGFESDDTESDELPYARMVAERFSTQHHEVIIRAKDFTSLAQQVTWHLDQPIADQATIATMMVSRLAASHVKMVLSGEGGDELFAGYARYVGESWSRYFNIFPSPLKSLARSASQRLPGLRRPKIAIHALTQPDEVSRFTNWFPLFNTEARGQLLTSDVLTQINGNAPNDVFAAALRKTSARDYLNRMLYVDSKYWLPDYLLLRGDKLTMSASLEGRVPLLDHRLVEFAGRLPTNLKIKRGQRKYLLKKVARRYLPAEIIDRKKQGFPIPISSWFRSSAREFVGDLLSPSRVSWRGLFRPEYVQRLLNEHQRGFADHGDLLWGLISIELWQQAFIDQAGNRRQAVKAAVS